MNEKERGEGGGERARQREGEGERGRRGEGTGSGRAGERDGHFAWYAIPATSMVIPTIEVIWDRVQTVIEVGSINQAFTAAIILV